MTGVQAESKPFLTRFLVQAVNIPHSLLRRGAYPFHQPAAHGFIQVLQAYGHVMFPGRLDQILKKRQVLPSLFPAGLSVLHFKGMNDHIGNPQKSGDCQAFGSHCFYHNPVLLLPSQHPYRVRGMHLGPGKAVLFGSFLIGGKILPQLFHTLFKKAVHLPLVKL